MASLEKARTRAENERRDELDGFREGLQPYSGVDGFKQCGRLPIPFSKVLGIPLKYDGKRARWGELQRCRKVHLCPTCGQEIRATRRAELEQGNRTWVDSALEGAEVHTVAMATFTLRHFKDDSLADLLAIQRDAWSYSFGKYAGQHWKRIRARFGIVGDVRVWETTHGARYGWHPHWHVQYMLKNPLTAKQAKELETILADRWTRAVTRAGGKQPDKKWAVKLLVAKPGEEAAFADYMTKEMTGQADKEGRKAGQRTPHQIAQDWLNRVENLTKAQRDALTPRQRHDLALWREYEAAVHGLRYMRWSRGLKELLGIDTPDNDEDLKTGEEQAEEESPTVLSVTYTAWFRAIISRRGRSLALRKAMEAGGVGAVHALVEVWNREDWDRWWRTRPEKRRGDGPFQIVWGRDIRDVRPGQEPEYVPPVSPAELSGGADPGKQLLDAMRQQQAIRDAANPKQLALFC
ncbi:hypothetical protein PUR71_00925 [Streptomyces sp. SP17BM10]|uniref:hypothetical protein n=1 Tax=Streptomyces sp. SP17BM10 TaxID=3002530 RepID=UPI002E786CD1|nr:hypothetical protein [Streptomyces sp. SP17BM10]MEE1781509.1 hypothetical protein [Streptomyces sp. SP17BM10]